VFNIKRTETMSEFQEFPKWIHHPDTNEGIIVDSREAEDAQFEEWGAKPAKPTKPAKQPENLLTPEEPKTALEVLAMATADGVPFMTFKAAAAKLLGDKTPSKKDELIAALEDLATQP
jgi:hypothetical protein